MQPLHQTAIVILNWNGKSYLEKFLPGIIKNSNDSAVYVADNNSTDDSVPFLRTNFPQIQIINIERNYGFAKGYNFALSKIVATYFIILNNDVEVSPGWLSPLIEHLKNNNVTAACQPKIMDLNRREYFEYAGAAGGFVDKLYYPFCRGRIFSCLEKDEGQYNDTCEIFWASGACMAVRSDVFFQFGGFDENFFAHQEEIDLCWRMKNAGYKIMYIPESVVYHKGAGTLAKSNPRKTYLNFRNSLIMVYKNLHFPKSCGIIVARLFLDGLAGMNFLVAGKLFDCIAIIRAHFSFYSGLNKWKRNVNKRNDLYLTGRISKSIVWGYFFRGRKTFGDYGV
ncbi:MAG: glycosyl transferase family 2 [Bacteroidetes bacterium RIFCSPLOWO2_02_FULL_36_8]|nr:MAG: glycosyl transferase family 2 [Bacteroidetes bacterium RIFCSPLOWO2_02_FULL_36_8]OFY71391.1 MAG: glycosyl transferase family 2 [Bacteroidetes bacterium RIFCSPLOWO2_12_FULL_37_12]